MTLQEEIAAMLEAEERRLGVESEEFRQRHNELMERIDRLVEAHRSRKEEAMEYQEIKDWLDRLAENRKEALSLERLNSSIETTTPSGNVHIYKGIETVADTMGLPLQQEPFYEPTKYYFIYREVEFFQFGKSDEKR